MKIRNSQNKTGLLNDTKVAAGWYFIVEDVNPSDGVEEESIDYVDADFLNKRNRYYLTEEDDDMNYAEYLDKAIKQITEPDAEEDKKLVTAVDAVIELSNICRKEGILSLEEVVELDREQVPLMPYVRSLIILIVDGTDPEFVKQIGLYRIISSQATGYEALMRLVYLEGILSIQAGENPYVIQMKLLAMLPDRIIELYKKSHDDEENDDKGELPLVRLGINKYLFNDEPDKKEEVHVDPIEKLCGIEKIGLNDTDECYFEMRLLEYVIKNMDHKAIQRMFRDIDRSDIIFALKGMSGEANTCILSNMSSRVAEEIAEEILYMGPIRLKDVRDAARKILNTIFVLEDTGEIILTESKMVRVFLELLKENDMDREKEQRIKKKETELEELFKEYRRKKKIY